MASALPVPTAAGMAFDQLRLSSWPEMAIAPDGKRVAFVQSVEGSAFQDDTRYRIFVAEVGGTTSQLAELDLEPRELRWAPDGASLLYFQEGRRAEGKLPQASGFSLFRLGLAGAPVLLLESEKQAGHLSLGVNPDLLVFQGNLTGSPEPASLRLFELSTGTQRMASDKDAFTPTFSPDGSAIAFFEREAPVVTATANALVIYTLATQERRVVKLADDSAHLSILAWQPDGKGVVVYAGDSEHQVTARTFGRDGTPGAERTFMLPAKEGETEVAYNLSQLSPDGTRMVARRETATIKRNYNPEVITHDPLTADTLIDTATGAVLKTLDRNDTVLGWLDANRVLIQRVSFMTDEKKITDEGRLGVVSLP
jgi:Tol biopolymer transport system component